MRLDIHGQHLEMTDAVRAHTARRLQHALGRFEPHIQEVTVDLANAHGPHGEADKHCRMAVAIPTSRQVIVEVIDSDLCAAIDRATAHLERSVPQELARRCERVERVPLVRRVPASAVCRWQERIRCRTPDL
jgi:ribosomal subunit interface protein